MSFEQSESLHSCALPLQAANSSRNVGRNCFLFFFLWKTLSQMMWTWHLWFFFTSGCFYIATSGQFSISFMERDGAGFWKRISDVGVDTEGQQNRLTLFVSHAWNSHSAVCQSQTCTYFGWEVALELRWPPSYSVSGLAGNPKDGQKVSCRRDSRVPLKYYSTKYMRQVGDAILPYFPVAQVGTGG